MWWPERCTGPRNAVRSRLRAASGMAITSARTMLVTITQSVTGSDDTMMSVTSLPFSIEVPRSPFSSERK